MWPGHVQSVAMQPVLFQPGDADPAVKVVKPDDIMRAKSLPGETIGDGLDDDP